jgi:hypothetical protein
VRARSRERLEVPGVADQLPVAVRSPVAAVEDDYGRPHRLRKRHLAAVLVTKMECGCDIAYADRHRSPPFTVTRLNWPRTLQHRGRELRVDSARPSNRPSSLSSVAPPQLKPRRAAESIFGKLDAKVMPMHRADPVDATLSALVADIGRRARGRHRHSLEPRPQNDASVTGIDLSPDSYRAHAGGRSWARCRTPRRRRQPPTRRFNSRRRPCL